MIQEIQYAYEEIKILESIKEPRFRINLIRNHSEWFEEIRELILEIYWYDRIQNGRSET